MRSHFFGAASRLANVAAVGFGASLVGTAAYMGYKLNEPRERDIIAKSYDLETVPEGTVVDASQFRRVGDKPGGTLSGCVVQETSPSQSRRNYP